MMTQIRSSDEASRLYKELTDRISDQNEEEIRKTYKQLLRNGESLGAIVGAAISSIREMQDGRVRGRSVGDGSTSNEVSEAKRAPVELRQNASEVAFQYAPSIDAHIDRPRVAELQGADRDDQSFDAMSAPQRAQTEPTRVTSGVETRGSAAATDRAGDPEIHDQPHPDITAGPRLIFPPGVRQYLSLGSRPSRMKSPISAATRTIIVLTVVLVAAVGIALLLRTHRPADGNLAAPLHPVAVSPPGVPGLSRIATATLSGESAALGLDKRPTATVSTVASTATAAAIVATPFVIPTEMRASPTEVAPLLERGDALLATGDFTSARLFYEAAVDAGDASAALRLGATFDPIFINRANLRGVRADMERAVFWYRRARDLGSSDAENLLKDPKQTKP